MFLVPVLVFIKDVYAQDFRRFGVLVLDWDIFQLFIKYFCYVMPTWCRPSLISITCYILELFSFNQTLVEGSGGSSNGAVVLQHHQFD